MKNIMITGSYPPDICGVGDYTSCFMHAADLESWQLYYTTDWRTSKLFSIIKEINSIESKSIYMQYPTMGYGWSLVPLLLCLYYSIFTRKKFSVALHEFSQRTFKARIFTSLLIATANRIIFTNEFEKSYACRFLPFTRKKSSVVRIISNIAPCELIKGWDEREYEIAYFGHIRPIKGLEDFYDAVAKICVNRPSVRVAVIGQVLSEYNDYFNSLREKYNKLNVEYHLNAPMNDVSVLLNNSKITFLPFPDGISERRGSFLAAISNGSVVITYTGDFMTDTLAQACTITTSNNASNDIDILLASKDNENYNAIRERQIFYLTQILPNSWSKVVDLYKLI